MAKFEDYRAFVKKLQNDVNQYVQTSSLGAPGIQNASPLPNSPLPGTIPSFVSSIRELPASDSSEANRLEADARDKMTSRDLQGATSSSISCSVSRP